MLCRRYFTELFLTRSSARPRLLLGVIHNSEWIFFSSPHPKNSYEKLSLVVTADFHINISMNVSSCSICSYASGFLYFPKFLVSKNDKDAAQVICNPITGQYAILPKLGSCIKVRCFLGFDPIDKQFKVLSMSYPYYILTLGTGNLRWRKIECSFTHNSFYKGICIKGVLYYLAQHFNDRYESSSVIVCFDVRSEKFKFVGANLCQRPFDLTLINYKGKLGAVNLKYASDTGLPLELCVWVLEDVEKHEWSKDVYSLKDENKIDHHVCVAGMTATGEIVLSAFTSKPYYVYYFNPERNTLRRVEIQGFEEYLGVGYIVFAFVDYVEDLDVNDIKQLRSNPLHQGLNIIRKRPKPKCRAPSLKN